MPVLFFYLYNIFALYVVFVRLIHRAAPSHRIASIVRSATMHVFFMSLFQIRDSASCRHQSKSLQSFDLRHFMSLFQIRDIASRRPLAPNRFNRSICNNARFFYVSLSNSRYRVAPSSVQIASIVRSSAFYVSLSNSRYRVAPSSVQIASIVRSSVSMYGFLCRLRQCNWVKIQLRVRMG